MPKKQRQSRLIPAFAISDIAKPQPRRWDLALVRVYALFSTAYPRYYRLMFVWNTCLPPQLNAFCCHCRCYPPQEISSSSSDDKDPPQCADGRWLYLHIYISNALFYTFLFLLLPLFNTIHLFWITPHQLFPLTPHHGSIQFRHNFGHALSVVGQCGLSLLPTPYFLPQLR